MEVSRWKTVLFFSLYICVAFSETEVGLSDSAAVADGIDSKSLASPVHNDAGESDILRPADSALVGESPLPLLPGPVIVEEPKAYESAHAAQGTSDVGSETAPQDFPDIETQPASVVPSETGEEPAVGEVSVDNPGLKDDDTESGPVSSDQLPDWLPSLLGTDKEDHDTPVQPLVPGTGSIDEQPVEEKTTEESLDITYNDVANSNLIPGAYDNEDEDEDYNSDDYNRGETDDYSTDEDEDYNSDDYNRGETNDYSADEDDDYRYWESEDEDAAADDDATGLAAGSTPGPQTTEDFTDDLWEDTEDDDYDYDEDEDDQTITEENQDDFINAGKDLMESPHHFDSTLWALGGAKVSNGQTKEGVVPLFSDKRAQQFSEDYQSQQHSASMINIFSWMLLACLFVFAVAFFVHWNKQLLFEYMARWRGRRVRSPEEHKNLLAHEYA